MKKVLIYTDGSCEGNPGPGGFAAVIREDGEHREVVGAEPQTTNNRMELMAVIRALESLSVPAEAHVVTDSQYVVLGMTEWIRGWQRKRWKNASGQPVKNQDLWSRLLELTNRHKVSWEWIRGHSGHLENERADRLARAAIADMKQKKGE